MKHLLWMGLIVFSLGLVSLMNYRTGCLLSQQWRTNRILIAQLKVAQQQVAHLPLQRAQLAQTQIHWQHLQQQLFAAQNLPTLLNEFRKRGQATGIIFTDWLPQTIVHQIAYQALPINMALSGTYPQIIAFLKQMPLEYPALQWQTKWTLIRQSPPITIDKLTTKPDILSLKIQGIFYFQEKQNA